ncbi:hypothetical protein [Streptomyces atroolivaceus]|uniref:Uncharacterized protein n=1 Tax=Streptomyces atroolivaceus TaxID=66869 RepID=A0ABV9VKM3_STRAZ|nr:hypothetical protein [Streptomyces atroolivaceus]
MTVSGLAALHRRGQLPHHLGVAPEIGPSAEGLSGATTHLAFQAGGPTP